LILRIRQIGVSEGSLPKAKIGPEPLLFIFYAARDLP